MKPNKFLVVFALLILTSCSNFIEIVEGNFLKGKAIDHYKLLTLTKNESVIIGKIKVIDNVGAFANEGEDITRFCSIITSDNSSYKKDQYSIRNPNLITPSGIGEKKEFSNNHLGYFAIKNRGQDFYIDKVICYDEYKHQRKFAKTNYFISNKGQEVIGYEIEALSYLKIENYNQIYDLGQIIININQPDKLSKSSFRVDVDIKFNEDYNFNEIYCSNLIKKINKLPYNQSKIQFHRTNIKPIYKKLRTVF